MNSYNVKWSPDYTVGQAAYSRPRNSYVIPANIYDSLDAETFRLSGGTEFAGELLTGELLLARWGAELSGDALQP